MLGVILIVVTLVILYLYGTRNYGYWRNRGIKYDPPVPFIGNNWDTYAMKKSMSQVAQTMYWKYPNEKVVGFYRAMKPELIIRDPEIAKRILTTDFNFFYNRGFFNTHKTVMEPLLRNLFSANGDLWKLLRTRMTPAFSSGKLKAMFHLITERAERLQNQAINATESGRVMCARDIMARFTTDFIGAIGFGIDADSLSDPNSPYRKLGVETFNFRFREVFRQMLKDVFPELFKHVKIFGKIEKETYDLIYGIMKQRDFKPCGRNDFVDLFLAFKEKGDMVGEYIEKIDANGKSEQVSYELDDWILISAVFLFFGAGFETSSSATSFTLHELAYHPEEQKKVQEEVDRVLAKYNNKLTYDAIKEMTYLVCVFKEAMRIFPSLGILMRRCAHKYTFPELDITIDEDVAVIIPVQAFHKDPQYFDEPEKFRPERFLSDNVNLNTKYVYLPFGSGPRACIGERLGLMQSIAGLAAIISRYSVEPALNSIRVPVVNPCSSLVQNIEGGLPLLFRRRCLN